VFHLGIQGQNVPPALLGDLTDSAALLADRTALRERFAEDGYLLLRGLLPPARVAAARAEVLARLRDVGEVTGPDIAPVATGTSHRAARYRDLGAFWRDVSEGEALRACVHAPELHAATATLLDTPTIPFDFVWLRAVTAGRASPFHFDHPYMNRGSDRLVTCWIPLGDVALAEGPIVLVENSHRFEDLAARVRDRDVDREPGFSGSFPDDMIALAQARGTRFLSTDFRAGDVLIFGMFLLHGSLDNRAEGGRVRLSCDVRFQPGADKRDDRWFGHPPAAHGNRSYGGLSGAQPLTQDPIAR
jgi:ectoine hydroxylase-related dioxygenase (phytanoyl-CoA dioxygenase family)